MASDKTQDAIALLKARVKSDSREVPVEAYGLGAKRVISGTTIPISIKESGAFSNYGMKTTIYHIRSTEPLKPGEYILHASGRYYDLSVESAK